VTKDYKAMMRKKWRKRLETSYRATASFYDCSDVEGLTRCALDMLEEYEFLKGGEQYGR